MLQDDNNYSSDNNNKLTTRRIILSGYKCMKLLAQHMKKQAVEDNNRNYYIFAFHLPLAQPLELWDNAV